MKKDTLAERIIRFNNALHFDGTLPEGIRIMNPFRENESALKASTAFYRKYYGDDRPRRLIVGINPGRFGAGLTGVPFTDPKRLVERCGITDYEGPPAHEPSSVFIYEVIRQYGGEEAFYRDFLIVSVCPLGFTKLKPDGKEVNFNYYDRKDLFVSVRDFMIRCMRQQLAFGARNDVGFCLGTGKNAEYISKLNAEFGFFERIIPLEHPRFVIQYKTRQMQQYVDKYLEALSPYRSACP